MSSSENPHVVEIDVKEKDRKEEDQDEEKGGFVDKGKDFIHNIGEKIEEAVGFGEPTADLTGIHIPSINLNKADIVVDVLVENPNPIPIPLIDINYLVESGGRKLVSGLIPDTGTIHAHGSETVEIPITLIYDDIKNTYDDIRPGSIIPYKIKVEVIVDVPIFGRLTLPLEKTGEIPIPSKPDVDVEKISFEKFSFEETVALLHLKLENMNDFDLGLNALSSEIWLSGVRIGGAKLTELTKIDKNGISYIDLPITFRPKDLGSAVWDMIRGRGTGYSIKGDIDVDTLFGAMKLPISKEGGTTSLEKNKDGDDDDDDDDDELKMEMSYECATSSCHLSFEDKEEFFERMKKIIVVVKSFKDKNAWSEGTGFFLKGGDIVTCAHVVEGYTTIGVRFADQPISIVKIMALDRAVDLAILRFVNQKIIKSFGVLGGVAQSRVGMMLHTIGHPGLLYFSCCTGRLAHSALEPQPIGNRSTNEGDIFSFLDQNMTVIQVSHFYVTGGISRAPLFDSCGRIMGVVAFRFGKFSFAIHLSTLERFLTKNQRIVEVAPKADGSSLEKSLVRM